MKVKRLLNILKQCSNKNTKIKFIGNFINSELSEYDIDCNIEKLEEGNNNISFIIYNSRLPIDRNNSINIFLEDNNILNIHIDNKKGIFITNEKGVMLREIELKKDYTNIETNNIEIVKKLQQIL